MLGKLKRISVKAAAEIKQESEFAKRTTVTEILFQSPNI
jgi:hypothetical protein